MTMTSDDRYLTERLGWPDWTWPIEKWLAVEGLEIALWVIGAFLVIRFIRWLSGRYDLREDRRFSDSDAIVQSEDAKHKRALVDVVTWTLIAIVVIIVAVHVLTVFNIPFASLVGPGAVVGAALGFGAQRVVQDVLAGFFIVAERQYGYGDLVLLSLTGGSTAEGTVEDVTLRVTRLRTSDGEAIIVPNGQVVKASNMSREWARAVVDVPLPPDTDLSVVSDVLDRVGEKFYDTPRWNRLLLDPPASLGVTELNLDAVTMRMVARTLPGKQFEVSRALRAAVVRGLASSGIFVSVPAAVATAKPAGAEHADG